MMQRKACPSLGSASCVRLLIFITSIPHISFRYIADGAGFLYHNAATDNAYCLVSVRAAHPRCTSRSTSRRRVDTFASEHNPFPFLYEPNALDRSLIAILLDGLRCKSVG
jgi:hypothetical protein